LRAGTMVLAGDYGAARGTKRPVRTANGVPRVGMGMVIATLACVALLAVATFTAGAGDASPTELVERDLHFANTVQPQEVTKLRSGSRHESTLKAAKNEAQKRLAARKAKESKEVEEETREENELKKQLDTEVKHKQEAALKLSRSNVQALMAQSRAAKAAQNLKVKVTNADSTPDGDSKEEAALRKQLNAEATTKQRKMLDEAMPQLKSLRAKSPGTTQVSESALEKQLRAKLDQRVKKEKEGMYKSAMQGWLAKESGVSNDAPLASSKKGGQSASLRAAELIMKQQLTGAPAPKAADSTLQHQSLDSKRIAAAQAKVSGLSALESAMLKSTLHKARGAGQELQRDDNARSALREAVRAKQAKDAKPTYKDAMLTFTKRLNAKEQAKQAHYSAHAAALRQQFNQASKKDLEAAIKRKVSAKLATGSSRLERARAKLMAMFSSGPASPFAKAEVAKLKQYQARQQAKAAALQAPAAGSYL